MTTDEYNETDSSAMEWWGFVKSSMKCKICDQNFVEPSDQDDSNPDEWKEILAEPQWRFDITEGYFPSRQTCECLIDVFDDQFYYQPLRDKLWRVIKDTPYVEWLLLTSRPENIRALAPWPDKWPNNVNLGITVENQRQARERLPILSWVPASYKFVSAQPLRGSLDLSPWSDDIKFVSTGVRARTKDASQRRLFQLLKDSCAKAEIEFTFDH